MWEWGLGGGKGGEELSKGDVWTCAEVAERSLTLSGGEVEKDFLSIGGGRVLGVEAQEGFRRRVGLDV